MGTNLSTPNLSTLLFKSIKPLGTFFNLSMSNLSTSDFKLAKSVFLANSDVSTPVTSYGSVLWYNLTNLIQILHSLLKILVLGNIHSFILCLFFCFFAIRFRKTFQQFLLH